MRASLTICTLLALTVPSTARADDRRAPLPIWRARADIGFGLGAQAARVPDGNPQQLLAPILDVALGADRRIGRIWRISFGVAHVFPVAGNLTNSQLAPQRGDTYFDWRLALVPFAAIEIAPVSWWSASLGGRAGVGFGHASYVASTNPLNSREELGAWSVVHAFVQTAFTLPTRPTVGIGGRAAAGWSAGPEILLELMLTAAY